MDTGLNNSRGLNSRRNERLSKQDRKFNQSRASKIKVKYRTAIRNLENQDQESIKEVRSKIRKQEAKRITINRLVMGGLALILIVAIAIMMV